jgi:hypothetical protein
VRESQTEEDRTTVRGVATETYGVCASLPINLNRRLLADRWDPTLLPTLPMRTIEHLLETTGLPIEEIAARAGLSAARVAAIAEGRWTPSPAERVKIAAAFEIAVEEISWGHTMNPRNVRYRRFGLRESF